MKRVYISGPIDHCDYNERLAAFDKAQKDLQALGYHPVNPMRNGLPKTATRKEHMMQDIVMLETCNKIYMLKGWQDSKGCKLELDIATTVGLDVLFEHPTQYVAQPDDF